MQIIPPFLSPWMPIIGLVLALGWDWLNWRAQAHAADDAGADRPVWRWEKALQKALLGLAAGYGITLPGVPA